MPSNSTATIAIWRDVSGAALVNLSIQETGVRVRAVPAGGAGTTVELPNSTPNDGDRYEVVDADGSSSGVKPIVIVPPAGTTIRGAASFKIVDPFAGAVVTFDASADDWTVQESAGGGSSSIDAATLMIRIPIALLTVSSVTKIPIGAIVESATLDIVVAYSAGTTISLGQAGSVAEFMPTGDNNPTVASLYADEQDTAAVSTNPLLVTIAGAPAAGSGFAIVKYTITPNA